MYAIYANLRDKKGVKDSEVSRATGIPYSTLSDWKSGRYTPKVDKLMKLADYFGVAIEELLKDESKVTA